MGGALGRVLVIEDEPINLELMTALVEAMGCRVLAVSTPEEGLAAAVSDLPDVILTDVQLPGMDGYAVTRRLKADPRTAHIPVIAVTAQALPGEEDRAREAGCTAYLSKPVTQQHVWETIRPFLPRAD
jgi:CheY-like chemotaxis protein